MDVDPEVVPVRIDGLTRVHSHPYAELVAVRPFVFRHGLLHQGSGVDRLAWLLESHEKLVAPGVDLRTCVLRDRRTHEAAVRYQGLFPPLCEAMRERRRPLDVGEEEGGCPGR
jgi:hypothetical protein